MAGDLQHPHPGQAKINTGDYIRMQNRVDAMFKALSTLPGVVMDDFISLHLTPSKATAAPGIDLSVFRFGEVSRTADAVNPTVLFNEGSIYWGTRWQEINQEAELTATLSIGSTNYVYVAIYFSGAAPTIEVTTSEGNLRPTTTDFRVHLGTYTAAANETPERLYVGHVGNIYLPSTWGPPS